MDIDREIKLLNREISKRITSELLKNPEVTNAELLDCVRDLAVEINRLDALKKSMEEEHGSKKFRRIKNRV